MDGYQKSTQDMNTNSTSIYYRFVRYLPEYLWIHGLERPRPYLPVKLHTPTINTANYDAA